MLNSNNIEPTESTEQTNETTNGSEQHSQEVVNEGPRHPTMLHLEQSLADMREELTTLRQKLARGTREIKAPVLKAIPPIGQTLEVMLSEGILSTVDLQKRLGIPLNRVQTMLVEPIKTEKIYNLGTEERPAWTWRIGESCTAQELDKVVRKLISYRPMYLLELVAAIGARPARISAAIVAIQRSGAPIWNFGTTGRARWLLVGPEAIDARLQPLKK
jgi:hypothetical protein